MSHKANPVLSVLIRRAALTTPLLAATLHLCAAEQVDERADGAWHAEWDTLRILVRRTAVAISQTADLTSAVPAVARSTRRPASSGCSRMSAVAAASRKMLTAIDSQ